MFWVDPKRHFVCYRKKFIHVLPEPKMFPGFLLWPPNSKIHCLPSFGLRCLCAHNWAWNLARISSWTFISSPNWKRYDTDGLFPRDFGTSAFIAAQTQKSKKARQQFKGACWELPKQAKKVEFQIVWCQRTHYAPKQRPNQTPDPALST